MTTAKTNDRPGLGPLHGSRKQCPTLRETPCPGPVLLGRAAGFVSRRGTPEVFFAFFFKTDLIFCVGEVY